MENESKILGVKGYSKIIHGNLANKVLGNKSKMDHWLDRIPTIEVLVLGSTTLGGDEILAKVKAAGIEVEESIQLDLSNQKELANAPEAVEPPVVESGSTESPIPELRVPVTTRTIKEGDSWSLSLWWKSPEGHKDDILVGLTRKRADKVSSMVRRIVLDTNEKTLRENERLREENFRLREEIMNINNAVTDKPEQVQEKKSWQFWR